jgi:hypothetical protein
MDFRWEEDGSLRSHSALSSQTWVDLHFHRDEAGTWLLTESASLAGTGRQEYTLHPVRTAGDTLFYAYAEDPKFLDCLVTANDEELYMLVNLRGEEHVRFLLSKVTGEEALAVRQDLEAGRSQPGENDWQLLTDSAEGDDPVEVRNARLRVKSEPNNPHAHLALVGALGEVIDQAPGMKMAAYAQEMLAALHTTVEIDPALPDAHFGLAQYYLNAPPIAGGSLESAQGEAEVLAKLGSPLGEVVFAQLSLQRGDRASALERLGGVVDEYPDLEIARRLYIEVAGQSKSVQ